MKTRLLALVLACMMVLSVVPVAVFAEDTLCKNALSDGDHTLKSVEAAGGKAEYKKTVAPQCGKQGYDLFQCECGVFFADNFTNLDTNNHSLVLVDEGVEATCHSLGRKPLYECNNSTVLPDGKTVECNYTEGGEEIPMGEHTWKTTSTGNCENNLVIVKVCTVLGCGATEITPTDGEHKWSETPTAIVSKPYLNEAGELVNGLAEYTCTLCNNVKQVVIIADHVCDLKEVPYKPATCVADGNVQYWYCQNVNCAKKYDANGLELQDVVIPAGTNGGHNMTYNAGKAAVCNADTKEVANGVLPHYACSICKNNYADEAGTQPLESIVDTEGHAWAGEPVHVPPTCETWGFDFYGCTRCGARKEVIENTDNYMPTGHSKWYDEGVQVTETYTPCTEAAAGKVVKTWTCIHEKADGTVCGKQQTLVVDEHTKLTASFPATCTNYAYSFTYCKDCDASAQAATESYKGLVYDLTVDGETYKIIGEVTYTEKLDPANHNWKTLTTNPASCDADGDIREFCPDCVNVFRTEEVKAFHSVPQGEPVADVKATCTTDAYKTYLCAECGDHYNIVEEGTRTGHSAQFELVETVPSTCKVQGYDLYACTNVDPNTGLSCGHTEKRNYAPVVKYVPGTFYAQSEIDTAFATMELYKDTFVGYYGAVHPNATFVEEDFPGNCITLGLSLYYCPDCEKNLAVAISGTGMGHRNDGDFDDPNEVQGWAPTCTEDGATDAFVCANNGCGTFVEAEKLDKTNHKDAAGNSLLAQVTDLPAEKCARDHGYWYCEACDGIYTDSKGVNRVSDYFAHVSTLIDSRDANCTEYGYQHYACDNCELEYIVLYRDALGHSWKTTARQEPTCVEPGVAALTKCEVCGTVDKTNNGVELPATGIHMNSDKKPFTNQCTDEETNRTCTVCGNAIERTCHYDEPERVDPTCQEIGYVLYVCVDCGVELVEEINDGKLGEHNYDGVEWEPLPNNPNILTRMCQTPGCHYVDSQILYQVEYFVDIVNVLDEDLGYHVGYTDSSLIAVSVKVKADVPVWSVLFDVNYDENLTFAGAEATSEILNCTDLHNNKDDHIVTIYAAASNDTDKEATNVTLEGKEEVYVLYFRVNLPVDEDGDSVLGFQKTEATVTITPDYANNVEAEYLEAKGDAETIEILPFMDVNLDGYVNNDDALFMHKILMGIADEQMDNNNYQVALDINQDGAIEAIDYVYLRRYLVHAWTYEEMSNIAEYGAPVEELA